jgi:BirA family biotin operon repressor/biotin-[acetyl-CoA-carboxylase] ligase
VSQPVIAAARLQEELVATGLLAQVTVAEQVDSTNAQLLAEAATLPHLTALIAEHQTAGRGRQDATVPDGAPRAWVAPPRSSLLVSLLVRPPADAPLTLLPLVAGLATVRAVDGIGHWQAGLKWPNDVVVAGGKLAGILTQVAPTGEVVSGIGLNVHQSRAELPTQEAVSLASLGVPPDQRDRTTLALDLLRAYVQAYQTWLADPSRLLAAIAARTTTLGQRVTVTLPGGATVTGRATALLPDGALELTLPDGARQVVRAGDIHHLRPSRERSLFPHERSIPWNPGPM